MAALERLQRLLDKTQCGVGLAAVELPQLAELHLLAAHLTTAVEAEAQVAGYQQAIPKRLAQQVVTQEQDLTAQLPVMAARQVLQMAGQVRPALTGII